MKRFVALLLTFCFVGLAYGAEFKGVKMEDEKTIGDQKYVLNGMALRKVRRFGLYFNVYVAGLYLQEKETDSEKIINGETHKQLIMEFVRKVEKEKIANGWKESMVKGCVAGCDDYKAALKEFNSYMVDTKKGSRLTIDFYKDKVGVEFIGRKTKKGEINDANLAKNLLAIFIGPKPFDKRFKKSILGQGKTEKK